PATPRRQSNAPPSSFWRATRRSEEAMLHLPLTITTVAFGLLFAIPSARADTKALEEATRKEGTLTWDTSHTGGESAEAVGCGFTAKYPGINVTVVRVTAQVAYQRLVQDMKNNQAICDVFSSTDIGHDEALKAQGKLAKYVPENAVKISPEFQNF